MLRAAGGRRDGMDCDYGTDNLIDRHDFQGGYLLMALQGVAKTMMRHFRRKDRPMGGTAMTGPLLRWLCLSLCLAIWPVPVAPGTDLPADDVIMVRVRDNLPRVPMQLRGRLRSGHLRGGFEHEYNVEIRLDTGRSPAMAEYALRDRFGAPVKQLTVMRYASGEVEWRATPAGDISPTGRIRETDITWEDLALAFLWWPVERRVGYDTFRGRRCVVLELTPPAGEVTARPGETRRVWIDVRMPVVLQMEVRENGRPVRRLMARSFQKIDGQWMVKDMEMRSLDLSRRTILRIDDVVALTGGDAADD